jgi:hypothetical protein
MEIRMKKTARLLLTATFLIGLNSISLGMDPAAAPAPQPLISVNGHLIPSDYTVSICPNSLFSLFGFVMSCLGGALVYQGAQRIAEPSISPAIRFEQESQDLQLLDEVKTDSQGKWLTGQGLLLATAGIIAIFHQKIFNS